MTFTITARCLACSSTARVDADSLWPVGALISCSYCGGSLRVAVRIAGKARA